MSRRRAFTLIELLVIIAIIAILAGIILPATQAARESARRAKAASEINQLNTAIASAKDNMSARYVPSHAYIVPQYDLTPGGPNYQFNMEALSNLRQFFGGRFGSPSPTNPNIILSGLPNWGEIYGPQCLVFFLGGYRDNTFTVGFDKNTVNPFATTGTTTNQFYDFPLSRLWNTPNGGPPVYSDAWSTDARMVPYWYFSARKGNDYADASRQHNRNGVNVLNAGIYTRFDGAAQINYPVVIASMPLIDQVGKFVNKDTHQIICAGKNGLIGPGGNWRPGVAPYTTGQPGFDDQSNFKQGHLGLVD